MSRDGGVAVPWCEQCDEQLEDRAADRRRHLPGLWDGAARAPQSPWWFKFMAVATVIYLGYRAFQGVTWVVHHV